MYLFKSKINALLPVFLKNTVQDEKRKIIQMNRSTMTRDIHLKRMYCICINYTYAIQ